MSNKQRGRKLGSVSFMQVDLDELNRLLKPDAKVIVSIRYGQLVGLQGKPVNSNLDVITHCVASGKAELKLVDLSKNEEIEPPKPNLEKHENKDPDHVAAQAELETFEDETSPF
jgi:hypothetical protein